MKKHLVILLVIFLVLAIIISGIFIFKHLTGNHSTDVVSHATQKEKASSSETTVSPCQKNINSLQLAVDKYKSENKTYPINLALLVEKKYIQEIPKCPDGNTYSIDTNGKVFEDKNINKVQISDNTTEKNFTKEELAKYDGKDGRPCYVALYGVVYDITGIPGWTKGGHGHGIVGGKDWTALFEKHAPKSHKDPEFLKKFQIVGKYIGEANPDTTLKKGH